MMAYVARMLVEFKMSSNYHDSGSSVSLCALLCDDDLSVYLQVACSASRTEAD